MTCHEHNPMHLPLDVFDRLLGNALRFADPETITRFFPGKLERRKQFEEERRLSRRLAKRGIVRPFALKGST